MANNKLTHADKDRMLNELRDKLHNTDSALQAANAQIAALTMPPAQQSIAASQRMLDIPQGSIECDKCEGTGEVVLDNGEHATCYRCRGKGYMSPRDIRRHDVYTMHQNIAAMLREGKATKYLTRAEINDLPARERAGKRIVDHNGWLVLI